MKKKLLLLAAVSLSWLGASAQWVKPEAKSLAPSEVANAGTLVRVYNVEYGAFLGGANAWGTQTSLLEEGLDYKLEWSDDGQNYKLLTSSGAKKGKYLFRDNESGCFIDLGDQNRGFNWAITATEKGYYTIQSPLDDPQYGTDMYDDAAEMFFGWNGDKNIVYANVRVDDFDEEGNQKPAGIEWAFMTQDDAAAFVEALKPYNAAMALKKVIDQAKADYPEIDCSKAEAVFNNTNSTVEELKAAEKLVANAIAAIHTAEVLDGATEDDPKDGTELIINADFSTGDISGWECTFVSGTTATNVGYQGASYTGLTWEDEETGESGQAFFEKFIEAWANNVNEMKRDGKSFATIGDAKLCQTIYGMPAGKYKLAADVNAVQQWDKAQNPVTGVELYVLGGDIDSHVSMATGDGIPEHFILTFIHSGGDLELGLRTKSTTANWIGADNFTLKYYGPISKNPYQVILEGVVADVNKKYIETLEDAAANAEVKAALQSAYEAAAAAENDKDDAYYQDMQASLEAAVNNFVASADAYKKINTTIEEARERQASCPEKWVDLGGKIDDAINAWTEKYENGTFETGDEATVDAELNSIIADFVSENVEAGDDVSILLKNPGFATNFSGWAVTGTSPVWAANHAQGANNSDYAMECEEDAVPAEADGLAERYQAVFTMSQTIKNMPRGLYQLSCQGFNRKDGDGNPAELYAIMPDGSEQTAPFCDIAAYQTETSLYQVENGNDGWPADNVNGNGMYQPNGMSGAAWHFMHKSDGEHFDYTNKFNIVLTERGDITLGARCDNAKQWVIFDNFKVTYLGSGAAVYEGPIKDRIAEGNKFIDEALDGDIIGFTQDVQDAWDEVCSEATKALDNNDEDACIKAISDLTSAIEGLKENNKAVNKLADEYNYNSEYRVYELDDTSDALNAILDEVGEALMSNGIEKAEMIDEYIEKMNAEFNKSVIESLADDMAAATEENPVELVGLIHNARYGALEAGGDTKGWDITTGRAPGYFANDEVGVNVIEVWNATFSISQKLYSLPAGYYRLKVQAFQRNASNNAHSANALVDSIGEPLPAVLFAGNAKAPIVSSFSQAAEYAENGGEGATISGGKYDGMIVPNSMTQATAAFNMGLYENILQFKVDEAAEVKAFASQVAGKGDCIEIGIVKETNVDDAWVIWSDWKIEYVGTTEPEEDPTTAVESVSVAPIVAAQYFNVNGTQQNGLRRGVNIVKATKADGTVKMVKVLVK